MYQAAYGGNVNSNPITIAAIKRQREKERQKECQKLLSASESQIVISSMRMASDRERWNQRAKEERFMREFQVHVAYLRDLSINSPDAVELRKAPRLIAEEVAERHGYTYKQVTTSKYRFRPFVEAKRASICAVYVECPWMSLPQIGRMFHLDHTTVLHHLRVAGVYITFRNEQAA